MTTRRPTVLPPCTTWMGTVTTPVRGNPPSVSVPVTVLPAVAATVVLPYGELKVTEPVGAPGALPITATERETGWFRVTVPGGVAVKAALVATPPPVMPLPSTYTGSGPTLKVTMPLTGVSVLLAPSQLVTVTAELLCNARVVLPDGAQLTRRLALPFENTSELIPLPQLSLLA